MPILMLNKRDINFDDYVAFSLKNNNLYGNASYKHFLDNEWTIDGGASISLDKNNIGLLTNSIATEELASHIKLKVKKNFNNRFQLNFGAEHFITQYDDTFETEEGFTAASGFVDHLTAGFTETDIFFSNKFAMKLGVRGEYSSVLNDFMVSPRASLAYKSSKNGQFSLAYGDFYQNPFTDYLKYDTSLAAEKTSHYLLNYQFMGDGKTLRAEAYYKNYDNLTKYNTLLPQFNSEFNNDGEGYAAGFDVFWRDNKSIKNLDYWVSYSYLNTERNYRNFKEKATPSFAPKHNVSVVTKYWVEDWRSQVGFAYTYAAGRSYDNPNTVDFMAEKTKSYNNLSLNWAYLISQQKILYVSVNNALGYNNVNGYQYADAPDMNGVFNRREIRPTADTFFFVGFFWTISENKSDNQLDNL